MPRLVWFFLIFTQIESICNLRYTECWTTTIRLMNHFARQLGIKAKGHLKILSLLVLDTKVYIAFIIEISSQKHRPCWLRSISNLHVTHFKLAFVHNTTGSFRKRHYAYKRIVPSWLPVRQINFITQSNYNSELPQQKKNYQTQLKKWNRLFFTSPNKCSRRKWKLNQWACLV